MKTITPSESQLLNELSQSGFKSEFYPEAGLILTKKNGQTYFEGHILDCQDWFQQYQNKPPRFIPNSHRQFEARVAKGEATDSFVEECVGCGRQLVNQHPVNICGDCALEQQVWLNEYCGFESPSYCGVSPYVVTVIAYILAGVFFMIATVAGNTQSETFFLGLPGVVLFIYGVYHHAKHLNLFTK